jgi:hypothetical protein
VEPAPAKSNLTVLGFDVGSLLPATLSPSGELTNVVVVEVAEFPLTDPTIVDENVLVPPIV